MEHRTYAKAAHAALYFSGATSTPPKLPRATVRALRRMVRDGRAPARVLSIVGGAL